MQPYFDPTKKKTLKKTGRQPQKKMKMEDNLNKFVETRMTIFGMQPYFDPTRKMSSQKNGRQP